MSVHLGSRANLVTAVAVLLYEDVVDAILLLLECGGMFVVMLWTARSKGNEGLLAWREGRAASVLERSRRVAAGRERARPTHG